MSEPILIRARNIYAQQTHNRRMTWLLMVAFVLLIAGVGVGFDAFLNVGPVARIIILPFVILVVASGLWNFKKKTAAGLWEKPKAFIEDEEDYEFWLILRLFVGIPLLLLIIFFLFIYSGSLSKYIDAPFLRYLPIGTTLAVIIGIVSILTSLRWGMNSVLWSVHAKQPDDTVADFPGLLNIVQKMSLAAGIPCPSIYIVQDSDPNAFSIGTNPTESSIVVTTGLLALLDREELQGVIAHEMSHIRNSDTRLMTMITILFGAVLLLSEWMKKSVLLGGFAGSRVPGVGWALRGVLFIGWLLTLLLAPLIARIVAMAVSRQREYLADAGGAELTRNPKALAHALIKIENTAEPMTSFQKGIAHMCIVDPLGKKSMRKKIGGRIFLPHTRR